MNIRTKLRVCGIAIAALPATSLAFGFDLSAPAVEMTPAACMQAMDLPTGHDNLVDINSAPRDWLVWLGLDESVAAKIIGSRPYQERTDLLNRGILPQETYNKVKDRIIARHV